MSTPPLHVVYENENGGSVDCEAASVSVFLTSARSSSGESNVDIVSHAVDGSTWATVNVAVVESTRASITIGTLRMAAINVSAGLPNDSDESTSR